MNFNSFEKSSPLNINIRCINCNKTFNYQDIGIHLLSQIPLNFIDSHSQICVRSSQEISFHNSLDQINSKFEKLRQSLQNIQKDIGTQQSLYRFFKQTKNLDENAILNTLEFISQIYVLNKKEKNSIKMLEFSLEKLKGSPSILIQMEKVKNLLIEKINELSKSSLQNENDLKMEINDNFGKRERKKIFDLNICLTNRDSSYQSPDCLSKNSKESEYFFINRSLPQTTKESRVPLTVKNEKANNSSNISNFLSTESSFFKNSERIDASKRCSSLHNNSNVNESIQRQFYLKCLNYKMNFASDSNVQKISPSLLFKEVINKNLKKEEWDDFLEMAMKNAEKYINFDKIKPLSSRVNHIKRKIA